LPRSTQLSPSTSSVAAMLLLAPSLCRSNTCAHSRYSAQLDCASVVKRVWLCCTFGVASNRRMQSGLQQRDEAALVLLPVTAAVQRK
jgi:hypothetical protein